MAYIRVNHKVLEDTSSAIESYITKQSKKMKLIDGEVTLLKNGWQGTDYTAFCKKWNQINSADSTTGNMKKALKNYADFLSFSAKSYREAQSRAIDRSYNIPLW